jgi:hypothetical protein
VHASSHNAAAVGSIQVLTCRSLALVCAVALLATGCASGSKATGQSGANADRPFEYLDQQSGVTVSALEKPLLFAHNRSALSPNLLDTPTLRGTPNLRDYVSINAASVNRVGKLNYLLIAYVWSTFDERQEPSRPVTDRVQLLADGRSIELDASGGTPADFGMMRPVGAPSGRPVKTFVYRTDLATLRLVADAQELQVQTTAGDAVQNYRLWDDQRKALDQLVNSLDEQR